MPKKIRQLHRPADFDLDILSGETDLFRWFLLCYLFGKPIQSEKAVTTWRLFIQSKLDTPWAIASASEYELAMTLQSGGYTRYQHVTARGIRICMDRLIEDYEGSLGLMLENSQDEAEFSERLQTLYGVGPKIVEIFMSETDEIFARRVE